jgi:hypothetical protein
MTHQSHHSHDDPVPGKSPLRAPGSLHEKSDVNTGAVLKFGLGLLLAGVGVYFLTNALFSHFNEREARLEVPRSPLLPGGELRLPPEPRLQLAPGHPMHPLEEMKQLKDAEEAVLNSYGWVDRQAGTVRIPIEEAKRLSLQKGFPSNPGGKSEPGIPQVSSSGRTWERKE